MLAEYGKSGGTRTYIKQLLGFFSVTGASTTMIRSYVEDDPEMDALCDFLGIRVINAPVHKRIAGRALIRFFAERYQIKKMVKRMNPDITVASVGTPGAYLGPLSFSKKALMILHTYPHSQKVVPRWKDIARRAFYKWATRSTTLITVSLHAAKQIASEWGLHELPLVCYNTAGPVREPARVNQTHYQILTVGQVVWYKNPFFWIDVVEAVRKAIPNLSLKFLWLGDGPLLDECRNKVRELNAETFIEFRGFQKNPEIEYTKSAIYVQPSLVESLGLGVLDAMRHGVPAIVSSIGGLPEVIVDERNGFIESPDNKKGFVKKIIQLLQDHELRRNMGIKSRDIYVKKFTPEAWHDRLYGIFESILTQKAE